jgi:hypothetical protein
VANLLVLVGVGPDSPAAAVAPEVHPFDAAAAVVLALTAGAMALAWIAARGIGDGRERGDPSAPGAACTTALVLAMATVLLWLLNPFAALLLVPGLHLWTLAMLPGPAVGRRARVLLVGAGLLVPAGVAIYYLIQLSLDPLAGFWYLFLLVTGHQVGLFPSLLGCVLLGVLAGMAAIVAASREVPPPPDMRPKLRGTPTYAGPGSLGGTDSALGR